jgi:hypothetical protein
MGVEVDAMADINLDFLSPEKREFLRRRAEERGSTIEEELERAIGEVMEEAPEKEEVEDDRDEEKERPHRPIDELEEWHTPESLAEARRRDRELTRRMKKLVGGEETKGGLMSIAGIIKGESPVTSENIDDFLYGEWEDDE